MGTRAIEPKHETEFWRIIDACWRIHSRDPNGFLADYVREAMEPLAREVLLSFHLLFERLFVKAASRDLWGATKLHEAGLYADDFAAFVQWLIGHGKKTFEAILREPDDLVSFVDRSGDRDWDRPSDTIHDIPAYCLAQRGESALKAPAMPDPSEVFQPWTLADLEVRFPKLWRVYGRALLYRP